MFDGSYNWREPSLHKHFIVLLFHLLKLEGIVDKCKRGCWGSCYDHNWTSRNVHGDTKPYRDVFFIIINLWKLPSSIYMSINLHVYHVSHGNTIHTRIWLSKLNCMCKKKDVIRIQWCPFTWLLLENSSTTSYEYILIIIATFSMFNQLYSVPGRPQVTLSYHYAHIVIIHLTWRKCKN